MVLLGELPRDTPIPKVQSGWYGTTQGKQPSGSLPDGWREAIGLEPEISDRPAVASRSQAGPIEEDHPAYGIPVEQRLRIGAGGVTGAGGGGPAIVDRAFAARLRMAERAQAKEDAAKVQRENEDEDRANGSGSGVVDARDFLERRRSSRNGE
jgi:hypothetical protein